MYETESSTQSSDLNQPIPSQAPADIQPNPQSTLNSQQAPVTSNQSQQTPDDPNQDILDEPETEKPIISRVMTGLFILISLSYLLSTIIALAVFIILNKAMSVGGISPDFEILKIVPTFGLLPIVFVFGFIAFITVGFKMLDASKKSWWIGLVSLFIIPTITSLTVLMILMQTSQLTGNSGLSGEPSTLESFDPNIILKLFYSFPLYILILILFIVSYRKFHFPSQGFSRSIKIILVSIFLLTALPIFSYLGYGYYKSTDTDLGYSAISKEVDFHVYRSKKIPSGRKQVTKFYFNDNLDAHLAGKTDFIKVAYDFPLDMSDTVSKLDKSPPIILDQMGVDNNFNLGSYVNSLLDEYSSIKEQSLSVAKNQKAFIRNKVTENFELKLILFVTEDNVLIQIVGLNISSKELIDLAESLE